MLALHLGSLNSICYVLYWTAKFPSNIALYKEEKNPTVPNKREYLCARASFENLRIYFIIFIMHNDFQKV